MSHLYAIVLQLAAMRPGAIPADHGQAVHGALHHLIERGSPELSQQWHDANMPKPFTVSLLNGDKRGRDGALHFGEGDEALWRFTLLRDAAFDAVLNRYIMNNRQPHVRIGAVQFAITAAYAQSHPDSGTVTLTQLIEAWQMPPAELPERIRLRFISPTLFNFGHRDGQYHYQLIPEPRHLFSSLKKKWDNITGTHTPDSFDDWVEANVTMAHHETQIRHVRIRGKRPAKAFIGNVFYTLAGADRTHWAFVNVLADLTFWTGVGYQTTAGLGQVRRMDHGTQIHKWTKHISL